MDDHAFIAESARRRSLAIDRVGAVVARHADARCELLPAAAAFSPAVAVDQHGRRVATVSAHALGCSVLLGPDEELIDLDDLDFSDALLRVESILGDALE